MTKNTTDELKTFIGEKIGEATMQWEPIPSGVFKSEKAVKILDEIYEAVEQLISNREKLLLDRVEEATIASEDIGLINDTVVVNRLTSVLTTLRKELEGGSDE